jgi:hypothetical protein
VKAGSTKNLKTVSGDAAIKIWRSILVAPLIAASTFHLFVLPPVSTVTTHDPRMPQARPADWQWPID